MNSNKGFTLIELIVAIVLLTLVAGITTYSITSIIKKSKQENYELLIKNINSAAETYYQECMYSRDVILDMMNKNEEKAASFCDYNVSLGELVTFGYLQGNTKIKDGSDKDKYKIVNPLDNGNIGSCEVSVNEVNNKLDVIISDFDSCAVYEEVINDDNNTNSINNDSTNNSGKDDKITSDEKR